MTGPEFSAAASIMQELGVITSGHGWKTSLANKLGVSRPTIDRFEREGTAQTQTDYAIAALVAGLDPYPN